MSLSSGLECFSCSYSYSDNDEVEVEDEGDSACANPKDALGVECGQDEDVCVMETRSESEGGQ